MPSRKRAGLKARSEAYGLASSDGPRWSRASHQQGCGTVRCMSRESGPSNRMGAGVAIGVGIGTALGVATDRIELWIPIGIAMGLCIGYGMSQHNSEDE